MLSSGDIVIILISLFYWKIDNNIKSRKIMEKTD